MSWKFPKYCRSRHLKFQCARNIATRNDDLITGFWPKVQIVTVVTNWIHKSESPQVNRHGEASCIGVINGCEEHATRAAKNRWGLAHDVGLLLTPFPCFILGQRNWSTNTKGYHNTSALCLHFNRDNWMGVPSLHGEDTTRTTQRNPLVIPSSALLRIPNPGRRIYGSVFRHRTWVWFLQSQMHYSKDNHRLQGSERHNDHEDSSLSISTRSISRTWALLFQT